MGNAGNEQDEENGENGKIWQELRQVKMDGLVISN